MASDIGSHQQNSLALIMIDVASSAVGGLLASSIGFPLETVKFR